MVYYSIVYDSRLGRESRPRPPNVPLLRASIRWYLGCLKGQLAGAGTKVPLKEFGVPVGLIEGRFRVQLGGSWALVTTRSWACNFTLGLQWAQKSLMVLVGEPIPLSREPGSCVLAWCMVMSSWGMI